MAMEEAHVLVIEPNATHARMLNVALHIAGFHVTLASDGTQALRHLSHASFSAVVLDLSMPDAQSIKVLRQLQRDAKMDSVFWMVISTRDAADIRDLYGPLGDHFMGKPFNPWELVGRLRK